MTFDTFMTERRERLETFLKDIVPTSHTELYKGMEYVMFDGGKKLRPLLVYATGESLGASPEALDYVAASVELIHCYSLVHDDLPAMDDDDIRHNKPSCHKAFTETVAILVGDALQSLAFEILADKNMNIDCAVQLHLVQHLAKASGAKGMVLGQALDMMPEDTMNLASLEDVHLHKTGALIEASIIMGAHVALCKDKKTFNALEQFSRALGLAYQIQDDVLDLEATTETLGKPAQSDLKNDKQTYPVLLGIENSKKEYLSLYDKAMAQLKAIGLEDSLLAELTLFMRNRHN
jgi:geranylgeranyl diphosphate synthase, type II